MFYFVLSSLVVPSAQGACAAHATHARTRTTQEGRSTRSIIDLEDREPCLQSSRVRAITGRYKICPLYRVYIGYPPLTTDTPTEVFKPCPHVSEVHPTLFQTLYSPNKAHPSCL